MSFIVNLLFLFSSDFFSFFFSNRNQLYNAFYKSKETPTFKSMLFQERVFQKLLQILNFPSHSSDLGTDLGEKGNFKPPNFICNMTLNLWKPFDAPSAVVERFEDFHVCL